MDQSAPKRKAIICDIDGTLANDSWREHVYKHEHKDYDDMNVMSKYDPHHTWCKTIIERAWLAGEQIIFLTARDEVGREVADKWLREHTIITDFELIMRDKGDRRDDFVMKKEKYLAEIAPRYEVSFALDDKESVAEMFRSIGITVLHCAGSKW